MVYLSEQECSCYVVLPWWHWWFSRSMYTGILSVGKNPGENPISFKVYVCCIFGFQEKNGQRMSKVHLSGSQRCILNWPQVIFPNFKHRTSDLTFSLSRSMFIERSVQHLQPKVHIDRHCPMEIDSLSSEITSAIQSWRYQQARVQVQMKFK